MEVIQSIQHRIYEIRGERVMLDFDLAELYGVETKAINQAVKRNIARFPLDFMFQFTQVEWAHYRSQIVTAYKQGVDFELVNNQSKRGYLIKPYTFTEQGIAKLSGVLRSEKAIQMNIAIMRAFVAIRKIVLLQTDMKEQFRLIKECIE